MKPHAHRKLSTWLTTSMRKDRTRRVVIYDCCETNGVFATQRHAFMRAHIRRSRELLQNVQRCVGKRAQGGGSALAHACATAPLNWCVGVDVDIRHADDHLPGALGAHDVHVVLHEAEFRAAALLRAAAAALRGLRRGRQLVPGAQETALPLERRRAPRRALPAVQDLKLCADEIGLQHAPTVSALRSLSHWRAAHSMARTCTLSCSGQACTAHLP